MAEPNLNLWSSLLRESSKKTKYSDALVVFLGNSDCGKTKLVDKLCAHPAKDTTITTNYVSKEIMSYDYFETDETFSETDLPSKVGIWSISDKCFDNALQTVMRPSKTDRLLFLIGLDISKSEDECIQSLEYWLRRIIIFSNEYLEANGRSNIDKNNLSQYVSNIKSNKINSSDVVSSETSSSSVKVNTGFPIIVTCCKSDLIDVSSLKNVKEFQGKLRSICLQFGASLIYTSTTDKLTNISLLRKYIFHRLYPEVVSLELSIEDGVDSAFVPSGFDRSELIEISTGYKESAAAASAVSGDKSIADWSLPASVAAIAQVNAAAIHRPASPEHQASAVEMEGEDEWLTGLQNYINKVYDSNAGHTVEGSSKADDYADSSSLASGVASVSLQDTVSTAGGSHTTAAGAAAVVTTAGSVTQPAAKAKRPTVTAQTSEKDVSSFFQSLLSAKK